MNNIFFQKKFKIIHIDMDCFYAAVEMRDNPKLRDIPIAIGSTSKTKGVLCTSNYLARKFGVKAAMPNFKAFSLCPNLTMVPPRFSLYKEISDQIKEIFYEYTDLVEMISLDEAFLDVTNCSKHEGSATKMALEIKDKIFKRTSLTASAGVSTNKMISKISSDWNKPNGIFCVGPGEERDFMAQLPLRKIPGIGPIAAQKLERHGFKTCSDILERPLPELINLFEKRFALSLYESSLGIDNSPVNVSRSRKSFSLEHTFFDSITKNDFNNIKFDELLSEFQNRLFNINDKHLENKLISTIFIKIRFEDFKTYTKEITLCDDDIHLLTQTLEISSKYQCIFKNLFEQVINTNELNIRLCGVGIKFKDNHGLQLNLPLGA